MAPPDGRPTEKSAPSRRLYDDTLDDAKVADRTARDWRAASKLKPQAYGKYLTKLIEQRRFVLWWDQEEKNPGV